MLRDKRAVHGFVLLVTSGMAATMVLSGCSSDNSAGPTADGPTTTSSVAAAPAEEEPSEAEVRNDNFVNKLDGAPLLDALRRGGYVVFIRHGQTEKDYADQVSAVMGDCSTQRMLSEECWQQGRTFCK